MKRVDPRINPLSIVAVFAALSEASATAIMPYLEGDERAAYIWFLIAFPSVLVLLFFLTLNFNSRVLYLPTHETDKNNTVATYCSRQAIPLSPASAQDNPQVSKDASPSQHANSPSPYKTL